MDNIRKGSITFVQINEDHAGQRLDNFLIHYLKGVPKSHVYRLIRSGQVRVNKGRSSADYRLMLHDNVRLPPVRVPTTQAPSPTIPAATFPIIYEDATLLVINKPAGVAVHGGSGVSFGVIEQLRRAHPDWPYLELVHRLDRETSGLLMLAKKRSTLTRLHMLIRDNIPEKRYLALCKGQWPQAIKAVKLPLHKYHTPNGERRVNVSAQGQYAHTHFTIQTRFTDFTLMEARLHTGRTHQIRVHAQSQHCPIAGDEKYGDFTLNKQLVKQGLKRMFLHAYQLQLPHPVSAEPLTLIAPLPDELATFLNHLKK